jgi:hypothetical protein
LPPGTIMPVITTITITTPDPEVQAVYFFASYFCEPLRLLPF